MPDHDITIPAPVLTAAIRAAIEAAGVPAPIADVEAGVMVDADLAGVPSHGVVMLPRLLAGLRDGRCRAVPAVRLVRERGATCVLDGDNGPGRFVAVTAMDHAMARARQHGVGVCLAVRTTHWGRAHAYAARAASAGMVGLCTTNAIPTLALPGTAAAALGNNPLAIGVPRGDGRPPVVLDLAMTQAALGKVGTHRREQVPVPDGWGLDRDGRPSTDAAAILASGLLQPMGGHKGVGLAVMMELLTAGLAGGLLGHEIHARDASGLDPDASKLFVAMDAEAFGGAAALAARVEAMGAHLRRLDDSARLPDDRGSRTRDVRLRDGVPLHPDLVATLAAAGVMLDGRGR
jgi:LDH2 family malate/lactate/ureidoglycolate dehydrogenase